MAKKLTALLLVTCAACGGQSTDLVDEGTGGESSSGGETSDTAGDGDFGGSGGDNDESSTGGRSVGVGGTEAETGGGQGSGGDEPSSGGSSSGGAESAGGTSSGGSVIVDESIPLSEMKLAAKLSENATCWQDNFPNMACTEIPNYEPAVIEWLCDETMAKVLVPPGVCLRISGRFEVTVDDECRLDPTAGCRVDEPEQDNGYATNTTDEIRVLYIHRRKDCDLFWTAWWYAGECPAL